MINQVGKQYDKICDSHDFIVSATRTKTCTKEGYKLEICDKCGKPQIEVYETEGHKFSDVTTIQATCTSDGEKVRTCEVCGEVVTEKTSRLDHEWEKDFTIDTAATCMTAGIKSIHCSRCSATKNATAIDALGHNFDTVGEVVKAAKLDEDGLMTYKCLNDGCSVAKNKVVPMTGKSFEDASWEEVVEYVNLAKEGKLDIQKIWNIGDEKTFESKNNQDYTVRIIGFYHDNYATTSLVNATAVNNTPTLASSGQNNYSTDATTSKGAKAPVTFEVVSVVKDEDFGTNDGAIYFNAPYNAATNAGFDYKTYAVNAPWYSNNNRTYNLVYVYNNVLPDVIKNAINYSCKESKLSYNTTSTGFTADKLWMPSSTEVAGAYGASIASAGAISSDTFEGTLYEYYRTAKTNVAPTQVHFAGYDELRRYDLYNMKRIWQTRSLNARMVDGCVVPVSVDRLGAIITKQYNEYGQDIGYGANTPKYISFGFVF